MFTHKRNFDCVMCGTPVLIRKIISGHILRCGCGEQHTSTLNPELVAKLEHPVPASFVQWTMTWNDNGETEASAWVPNGAHPSNTNLWGLINYAEMHDEEYTIVYKGNDVFGRPVILE